MSLKEKLKGTWSGVKKDWKESKKRDREVKSAYETARHTERVKQAARFGGEVEKIKTEKRLKALRTSPRSIGFQASPLFSGGMFGETAGIRRTKVRIKRRPASSKGINIYVNGKKSKPSHRRKRVRREKDYSLFGDSLF